MKTLTQIFCLILFAAAYPNLFAQDDMEDFGPKPKRQEEVRQWDAENQEKYADNPDVLLLPGLVADRKEKQVEVLTESTGLSEMDAAEFLVIHTSSFHGYEALLWSHAKPSDIHRALEFIGLSAGGPRDPSQLRFWGKGEQVIASVRFGDVELVRLEEVFTDRREGESIPHEGLIFTGSITVPKPDESGETGYAADLYNPHSIISGFNDPAAVFDVGWEASKGEAYQFHTPSPDYILNENELYSLILEPKSKDGETVIRNLTLNIEDQNTFILTEEDTGQRLNQEPTISAALEVCQNMVREGLHPYVTLRFNDAMTLRDIQPICRGMTMLDRPELIRIEPPAEGRLYYRSFVPNERWREPANRANQTWEIHLEKQDNELSATMAFHAPQWEGNLTQPKFETREVHAPAGSDIRQILDDDAAKRKADGKQPLPSVLMVYAPADITYGELLDFLAPALETHNTVHLFLYQ